jgi:hypothetical protein
MPRAEERTVPFFPFYAKDGDTLYILEDRYKCKGSGFFLNVLRFLAQTTDHYYCIADETRRMRFFAKTKCDEKDGLDMLDIMAKTGKIDKDLWITHRLIASQDFLDSLKVAYSKRSAELITMDQIRETVTETPVSGTETPYPAQKQDQSEDQGNNHRNLSTKQSRAEQSREKQSKEDACSREGEYVDNFPDLLQATLDHVKGFTYTEEDKDMISESMVFHHLDTTFIEFSLEKIKKRALKSGANQFLRSVLTNLAKYMDWIEEWKNWRKAS